MIFRIRIGRWRFTFSFAPVTDVVGVNSTLPDGNHIIMWDFDETPLEPVKWELKWVQRQYGLPKIRIFNTGLKNHYVAYCLARCTWKHSVEIVASTRFIDENFFKYGVYRGHWTIRVTPKEYRKIRLVKIINSPRPEGVSTDELRSWTKYETLSDTAKTKLVEINVPPHT